MLCWFLLHNKMNPAVCIHASPSCWASLPLPPTPLGHQSPELTPCAAQQLPDFSVSHMVVCVCQCSSLSLSPSSFPSVSTRAFPMWTRLRNTYVWWVSLCFWDDIERMKRTAQLKLGFFLTAPCLYPLEFRLINQLGTDVHVGTFRKHLSGERWT